MAYINFKFSLKMCDHPGSRFRFVADHPVHFVYTTTVVFLKFKNRIFSNLKTG